MLIKRIIPCLLLSNRGLVKTTKFSNPKYIGDPINAIRIFNEKEVDELIVLDILKKLQKLQIYIWRWTIIIILCGIKKGQCSVIPANIRRL